MRHEQPDRSRAKGWFCGPWNADLPVSIGYANRGIDEPHLHTQIHEIYLVASGTAELRVEQQTLHLRAGDVVVIDPGEAHTFRSSSPDYLHFVVHAPGLATACLAGAAGQAGGAQQEKVAVPPERLA